MKSSFILASGSPRRHHLMREFGYDVEIRVPEVEEAVQSHQTPRELAQENANLKAEAVAGEFPESLVLAADTVVDVDGRVFGKPLDFADAVRMLTILQGRTHQVVTAVRLEHRTGRKSCEIQDFSRVEFLPLTEAQIRSYLEEIHPFDKAGAYAAQDSGDRIIARIEGSRANVIGLPMERLAAALGKHFPDYVLRGAGA